VAEARLHGDHHAVLEQARVVARDHRVPLMPPGADRVAGDHVVIVEAFLGEALDHEVVDLAGASAGSELPAAVEIDVACDRALLLLPVARAADHGAARLVAGIGLHIADIVGADGIACREGEIALASIGDGVTARIQDAMHELRAALQAMGDQRAVQVALARAGLRRREAGEEGVVEDIRADLQARDLAFGLLGAHMIHDRRRVDGAHLGQLGGELGEVCRRDIVQLEPDLALGQAHVVERGGEALDRRLDIALIDIECLDPRIALGEIAGDRVQHDAGLAATRPHDIDRARAVGEVDVAGERAGIGEARELGEVEPGPSHQGVETARVHRLVEAAQVYELFGGGFHALSYSSTVLNHAREAGWIR
jgi:hypothetical protein